MTYASRVLDYLWSVAPDGATNSQIAKRLGIQSHQTVYMVTQDLLRRKLLRAERPGREWVFHAVDDRAGPALSAPAARLIAGTSSDSSPLSPQQFEALARRSMSEHYGVLLAPGSLPGVRKQFDMVSTDRTVAGDAKYFTLVRGQALPSAKFSVIAEHVWLLEKTGVPVTFLVFGNDRSVPTMWLQRYGNLAGGVCFFFLKDDGKLEVLRPGSRRSSTGI